VPKISLLISMKYQGKWNVREYIMRMSNIASKLKALMFFVQAKKTNLKTNENNQVIFYEL